MKIDERFKKQKQKKKKCCLSDSEFIKSSVVSMDKFVKNEPLSCSDKARIIVLSIAISKIVPIAFKHITSSK